MDVVITIVRKSLNKIDWHAYPQSFKPVLLEANCDIDSMMGKATSVDGEAAEEAKEAKLRAEVVEIVVFNLIMFCALRQQM